MRFSAISPTTVIHAVRRGSRDLGAGTVLPPAPREPEPRTFVWIVGDLDYAASATVLAGVNDVIDQSPDGDLVLDLSQVTFLDAAGLQTLLSLRRHAAETGRDLVLRAVATPARRLLELTGCDVAFLIEDSPGPGMVDLRASPLPTDG